MCTDDRVASQLAIIVLKTNKERREENRRQQCRPVYAAFGCGISIAIAPAVIGPRSLCNAIYIWSGICVTLMKQMGEQHKKKNNEK